MTTEIRWHRLGGGRGWGLSTTRLAEGDRAPIELLIARAFPGARERTSATTWRVWGAAAWARFAREVERRGWHLLPVESAAAIACARCERSIDGPYVIEGEARLHAACADEAERERIEANPFVAALAAIPEGYRDRAYRALASVLHPDAGGPAALMTALNEARDVVRSGAGGPAPR